MDFRYSGVAWAWSERPESPNVMMKWVGIEGQKTSFKVPSQILYKGDQIRWGFDIPPDEKPFQWFKLLLLQDGNMDQEIRDSTYIKEAKEMLRKLNKSAENVIADYLGDLWKHVLIEMKIALGEAAVDWPAFSGCDNVSGNLASVCPEPDEASSCYCRNIRPKTCGRNHIAPLSRTGSCSFSRHE